GNRGRGRHHVGLRPPGFTRAPRAGLGPRKNLGGVLAAMNCQPRWVVIVPLALAVWGIVSDRTALLMLAVVVFVVGCLRPTRRGTAQLRSVPLAPADNTPEIGGARFGRAEGGGVADEEPC